MKINEKVEKGEERIGKLREKRRRKTGRVRDDDVWD